MLLKNLTEDISYFFLMDFLNYRWSSCSF